MAVQDDRRYPPGRDFDVPFPVGQEDGPRVGLDLATAGARDVIEAPEGAVDQREHGGAQERLQTSLRALTKALERWLRPAERGKARAVRTLGKALEAIDAGKAEECYRWAAQTGDKDAVADLGVMTAVRGDIGEAKGLFVRAARAGHVRAMYNLGVLAESDDPEHAEEWYRRAADAGFADAMYNLGVHLEAHGEPDEAEEWYRRATATGHAHAMNNLGARLERRREPREAEVWYRRAAQAGHTDALNNLGAMLERRGQTAEAEACYRSAAAAGDVNGMRNLAVILDRRGEEGEAEVWHRCADPSWTPRPRPSRSE